MLIEFRVRNFRSFRDPTVFSMVASADKSLLENTIEIPTFGRRRLLRSGVVYGANSAGKTNLITAIAFMSRLICQTNLEEPSVLQDLQPFLFYPEPNQETSEFEMTFLNEGGVRFQYGFEINRQWIVREWLLAYPKGSPQTWFEREQQNAEKSSVSWTFGRYLKGKNHPIAASTRPDVLFLTNAYHHHHPLLEPVYSWFHQHLQILDGAAVKRPLDVNPAKLFANDPDLQPQILQLLSLADTGITGYQVQADIQMRHQIAENKDVYLPIQEESIGTQRLFAISGPMAEVLANGWILLMDELDNSLHPLLVKTIIQYFHNPETNPKGAQLIFNTQDTTLMDSNLFRRDQIWFVEKDRKGASHLYPLLDFSPRKDEALAKGYLMGRYGSIPFFDDLPWEG